MAATQEQEKQQQERSITYFDIAIGDRPLGRVVFSLYSDLVPKTAENFRTWLLLCFFIFMLGRSALMRVFIFVLGWCVCGCACGRRTVHGREGHGRGGEAAVVQGLRVPPRDQKVRVHPSARGGPRIQ